MHGEAQLEPVVALLEGRFGLDALLVFGSEARGTARTDSDLDLAALLRARPDPVALLEAAADIERLLGRSVDLVDLGAASPILAMQVLRGGRCVFGATSHARAEFNATLPSRYFDLKRVRQAGEAALASESRVLDADLVLAKVESLERCLARIADVRRGGDAALRPIDAQDITVLNLQRAVQR
jgi:predicted nucleotidyltransferase